MTALRHGLKSFAWVALLAICGIAFGPSVSRALAPAAAGSHIAHGHAHGMAMGETAVASHGHAAAAAGTGAHEHQHGPGSDPAPCPLDCCALCAVAATPFATVAVFFTAGAADERVATAPSGRAEAHPDRRATWPRAAPRGPPPTAT